MASISETNSPSSKKGEGEWPTGAEHYILNKDKDLIGKGAFANVYRAYCNPRNCYVAIKIIIMITKMGVENQKIVFFTRITD